MRITLANLNLYGNMPEMIEGFIKCVNGSDKKSNDYFIGVIRISSCREEILFSN